MMCLERSMRKVVYHRHLGQAGSETKCMDVLTADQAYRAMLYFPELYYNSTHDDGIGALLGGMTILEDGKPADPVLWAEWLKAVDTTKVSPKSPQ